MLNYPSTDPERQRIIERIPPTDLEAYLHFLDGLRESGAVNMFGACPFLQETYELEVRHARAVLAYWMETFASRHPADAS